MSHRRTVYVTLSPPKGGTKHYLSLFASKIQLLSKKSAVHQSFFCVKTSSSKDVATSFLYLTVDRQIAGDIYLKFALKVTHRFRKHRFRQISLNSAAGVRTSEKVKLLQIESRQCAFHRAIDEPCALPLSPPKGVSKRESIISLKWYEIAS